jgi:hypothetical protein
MRLFPVREERIIFDWAGPQVSPGWPPPHWVSGETCSYRNHYPDGPVKFICMERVGHEPPHRDALGTPEGERGSHYE